MPAGEAEQISVGDLLVTGEVTAERRHRIGEAQVIVPELVGRVLHAFFQDFERLGWVDPAPGRCGIGDDADKPGLGEWAGGPAAAGIVEKPLLCRGMRAGVLREETDQDVDVEEGNGLQRGLSCSLSSLRTRSGVMVGSSDERVNTRSPFTMWVGAGREMPRRIRSEAARPRGMPRFSAYSFTCCSTSSSMASVVRISTIMMLYGGW